MKKSYKIGIIILIIISFCLILELKFGFLFGKINYDANQINIHVGDDKEITYSVNKDKNITWHSLDESIVTIDNNGKIHGISNGKTRIYGMINFRKFYLNISVTDIMPEDIIVENNINLAVGDTYKIDYRIIPEKAKNKNVTFEIDDKDVVEVSNGKIKALKLGNAKVTIITVNNIKKEINVNVNILKSDKLSFQKTNIVLSKGSLYKIDVIRTPKEANDSLNYKKDDSKSILLNNDIIKTVEEGLSQVTVFTDNTEEKCNINVKNQDLITFKQSFNSQNRIVDININNEDLEYDNVFINVYHDNLLIKDKSVNEKKERFSIPIDQSGKWVIEAYLTFHNEKVSKVFNYNASMVSMSHLNNAISPDLQTIKRSGNENRLLFGSDYQGGNRKYNLNKILKYIDSQSINPNVIMFLGDYASGGYGIINANNGIEEIRGLVRSYNSFTNSILLFSQGNHDPKEVTYLIKSGEYEEDNYILYVINELEFPSDKENKSMSIVENTASRLNNYLKKLVELDIHKPVFVVNHLPLHYSSRSDNPFSSFILNTLNEYGDKIDIIYLFGHNHSGSYDNCLGGSINYLEKGSMMKHFNYDKDKKKKEVITTPINFTYLNAGYVGIANNYNGNLSCSGKTVKSTNVLTMSLFTIDDKTIKINRYSNNSMVSENTIVRTN